MNSDREWKKLCNILLLILFLCAHGASGFLLFVCFFLGNWLVMQLMTQTFSVGESCSLSGTKHPIDDCESWCCIHYLSRDIRWTNWSSDPSDHLQHEWKCQYLKGTEEFSLCKLTTERFFFPHQGNFFYYSFSHVLNGKCKGELFKWQPPNNSMFPCIPCINCPPQYGWWICYSAPEQTTAV